MKTQTKPKRTRKPRPMLYQVNHPMHSGGPKFSSITEACHYIAYAMRNGNAYLTIAKL